MKESLKANTDEAIKLGICGVSRYHWIVHFPGVRIDTVFLFIGSFFPNRYAISHTKKKKKRKRGCVRLGAGQTDAFQLPSCQTGSTILWGGDKLNVVQDLILGWKPEVSKLKATVSAFPHYDYRL